MKKLLIFVVGLLAIGTLTGCAEVAAKEYNYIEGIVYNMEIKGDYIDMNPTDPFSTQKYYYNDYIVYIDDGSDELYKILLNKKTFDSCEIGDEIIRYTDGFVACF